MVAAEAARLFHQRQETFPHASRETVSHASLNLVFPDDDEHAFALATGMLEGLADYRTREGDMTCEKSRFKRGIGWISGQSTPVIRLEPLRTKRNSLSKETIDA
jgi:hypothetical protein